MSSRSGGPQALFLHDVPQLAQVGLSDGVIGFQLKGPEVICFSVLQFPVEVQDGSQVHQGSRILKTKQAFRVIQGHNLSTIEVEAEPGCRRPTSVRLAKQLGAFYMNNITSNMKGGSDIVVTAANRQTEADGV